MVNCAKNVRGWWSEDIEGDTGKAGNEFNYRYQDVHRCRIKVIELVSGERVAWRVLDSYFDFTQDKAEFTRLWTEWDDATGRKHNLAMLYMGSFPEEEEPLPVDAEPGAA